MENQRRQRQYQPPSRNYRRGSASTTNAYENSGFQNLGGMLSDSLQETGQMISDQRKESVKQKKLEEEKAGLMVEGFMANMSDDMDLTAIPEEDKGIITEFSINQKQIFADAAEAAACRFRPPVVLRVSCPAIVDLRLRHIEVAGFV